jgi:hypothetical protein
MQLKITYGIGMRSTCVPLRKISHCIFPRLKFAKKNIQILINYKIIFLQFFAEPYSRSDWIDQPTTTMGTPFKNSG